jgi:spermidine synthase
VVGLGIGTLAAYSVQGQDVNFYEIDPDVMRLSLPEEGEKTYFYYLQDAAQQGAKVGVILGDGRLALKRRQVEAILADGSRVTKDVPDNYYQIIVLDAFSSDAIPVHLLTDEAVKLYLKKLADGGILIFNTTNRYVDMNPVLGDLAHHNDLIGLQQGYIPHSGVHDKHGYLLENVAYASDWVIMVKRRNNWKELTTAEAAGMLAGGMLANQGLGGVPWTTVGKAPVADWPGLLFQLKVTDDPEFEGRAWRPAPRAKRRIWTDDYSNLLGVLIW